MDWNDVDWGNAPSWVAVSAGVIGAFFAAGAYRREGRRDDLAAELRLREQANRVVYWREQDPNFIRDPSDPDGYARPGVTIMNGSDLPLSHVRVDWWDRTTPTKAHQLSAMSVMAPQSRRWFQLMPLPNEDEMLVDEVVLTFTDAQELTWVRDTNGIHLKRDAQPSWFQRLTKPPKK